MTCFLSFTFNIICRIILFEFGTGLFLLILNYIMFILDSCLLSNSVERRRSWQVSHIIKIFFVFYKTRRFIAIFTTACYKTMSVATLMQFKHTWPFSVRYILTLSCHLRLRPLVSILCVAYWAQVSSHWTETWRYIVWDFDSVIKKNKKSINTWVETVHF